MRSMTGYGSGSAAFPGGRVTVEIRTVNHRFLELKMPLPREFLAYEQAFRALIESHLTRGKVDLFLSTTGKPPRRYTIEVNLELARAYRKALTRLHKELGMSGEGDFSFLTAHPELFQVEEQAQATEVQAAAITKALTLALAALDRQRLREGRFLQKELKGRVALLDKVRRQVNDRSGIVYDKTRARLKERITVLLQGLPQGVEIDQSRLLQEVATLAQRGDITEELVRLQGHIKALNELLHATEPAGKRFDFLLQEVQREVNTIGSKADDTEIRHLVVSAKEEVEKLREQVQNVE